MVVRTIPQQVFMSRVLAACVVPLLTDLAV
jgi:hypothetical protein